MVVLKELYDDAKQQQSSLSPQNVDRRRTSARIKHMLETKTKTTTTTDQPRRKTSKSKANTIDQEEPDHKSNVQKKRPRTASSPCGSENSEVVDNDAVGNVNSPIFDEKRIAAYAVITDTLRTFSKYHLRCIQEEEKRCPRVDKKANGPKPKKEEAAEDVNAKKSSKRPDLKAIARMKEDNKVVYFEKRIGPIPGIDVGHQFFSRAEMVVVGLHHHWLNGIDYIGATSRKKTLAIKNYTLPVTVCIVLSGQYEDNLDNRDEIVYTGQGGNDLLGNKSQVSDQELKRGNLGLQNSMEQSVPVRVVRGHKCKDSYVKKVYTYDGLYKVVKCWLGKGNAGFTVYQFLLKRLEGQPPLETDRVHFTRGRIPNSVSDIRGLVCEDITNGLEKIPIPVTNLVDDPPIPPPRFAYIKEMKFSKNIRPTAVPQGCNCRDGCTNPRICACAKLNGGDFPYVQSGGGRLIEPKGVVFECGPKCGCGPKCCNRTSQKGPKFRLEIFRTANKGWGVRSWDNIPSGAPVCEYIGLVKRTDDLDIAADNTYVIDIDCLQTIQGLDGRESRLGGVSLPSNLQGEDAESDVPFCIDAGETGNVARFINHSCQPNLFVQCILSNHHDITLARIVLVAADNIPPLTELNYDYGYELDSVKGPDGKVRQMSCNCGAQDCRKRLY